AGVRGSCMARDGGGSRQRGQPPGRISPAPGDSTFSPTRTRSSLSVAVSEALESNAIALALYWPEDSLVVGHSAPLILAVRHSAPWRALNQRRRTTEIA